MDIQTMKDLCDYQKESSCCRYCGHHIWDKSYSSVSAGICSVGGFPVESTSICDGFERVKQKDRCRRKLSELQVGKGFVWLPPYEYLNELPNKGK